MFRSLTRLLVVAGAGLALASACGSEDSKKSRSGEEDEAGAAGEATKGPSSGGSKSFAGAPGEAGMPPIPVAGGAGGAEPMPSGGVAGAGGSTVVNPEGGVAGEPSSSQGGVAGASEPMLAGAGGVDAASGGAAGAPGQACCDVITCAEAFPDGGWGYYNDGCGQSELFCDCPPGTQRQDDWTCAACASDPNFCESACGDTVDNCGNPISCPDNCANSESVCYDGDCCYPLTFCEGGCGVIDDGCGGTIDCGETCDGAPCINGGCCYPDNPYVCLGKECGSDWDGCQFIDCGGTECTGSTTCIDGTCQESDCKAQGLNCGFIYSPIPLNDLEYCGDCPENQACIDNVCLPLCH